MKQRKKQQEPLKMSDSEINELTTAYCNEVLTNPKYSLVVDPENIYSFSDIEKSFIKYYIEFRSVLSAGELCGLDEESSRVLFLKPSIQEEIRRLIQANYQKRFTSKILGIDELGGYLSSMLTGENVPLSEQIKPMDKLKVVDMLLKVNELKRNSLLDPNAIIIQNVDEELKSLSVSTIKNLLNSNNIILSEDEIKYIESLPTKDVINMIEGGENHDE